LALYRPGCPFLHQLDHLANPGLCRGDRSGYWGYNGYDNSNNKEENLKAFKAMADAGIDFLDTAEVYGFGLSEEFVAEFVRATGTASSVKIATKFAPLPWRQTPGSLVEACRASLRRLDTPKMALYIQHWPGFFLNAFANDAYLQGLADCWEQGLTEAVGVSNFNADRVRNAAKTLEVGGLVGRYCSRTKCTFSYSFTTLSVSCDHSCCVLDVFGLCI
jgi:aryl-alcohol dehydrogenase-like predicted oxidoreductase